MNWKAFGFFLGLFAAAILISYGLATITIWVEENYGQAWAAAAMLAPIALFGALAMGYIFRGDK